MAGVAVRRLISTSICVNLLRIVKCIRPQAGQTTRNIQFCKIHQNLRLFSSINSKNEQKVCWKCHVQVRATEFVCSKCDALQSPNLKLNHFQIFGIEETFDINVPDLMNKFKDLQRKFHPDKFSQRTKTEQEYSAIYSAQINKAYQTLLKPFKRGLYILEIKGKPLEEENITMDTDFLTKIMEINETLMDPSDINKIKDMEKKNSAKIAELMTKVSKEFRKQDWESAQMILAEMKYYSNIEEKIKDILNEEKIGKI